MKEDILDRLVSFETAKLAKEKEFDEKCSHYYILDFLSFKADGILYKCGLPENCDNSNIFQYVRRTMQPHLANAPTQSLLQTWLREVHNIFVTVEFDSYLPDVAQYSASVKSLSSKNMGEILLDGFTIFDKFEKALEQGLQEALKLIN